MMMAADGWYIYTGRDGGVIPPGVTRVRIDESISVIPALAFNGNRNIVELICHVDVKTVGEYAFDGCRSLRIVRMPGVEAVERGAFAECYALTTVECGKLERIGCCAFLGCKSLTCINLSSAKIVERSAFWNCAALTNIKFSDKLERIEKWAFRNCTCLEGITIPLREGIITDDNIFQMCENLKQVDLVEGALHDTIAALLLEEWKIDMKDKIDSINQILPTTPAGDDFGGVGEKAEAVQSWISSVLRNIIGYKAQHRSYLNEAATTLQLDLPNDIVNKNVLPFLELPS